MPDERHDLGELVQVAYADDPLEAEMIRGLLESRILPALMGPRGMDGPMYGYGSLGPGFDGGMRRVMVGASRAEEARALLAKTLDENEREEHPEIANARYREGARGRKPRSYGLVGSYARIYLWSFGTLGVAFAISCCCAPAEVGLADAAATRRQHKLYRALWIESRRSVFDAPGALLCKG